MTEIKRNKPFIRQWINALRSGDYAQTTGRLHRVNDGYCCLGVACQISDKAWSKGVDEDGDEQFCFVWAPIYSQADSWATTLSPQMRDYIGISEEEMNQLVDLNDGGYNFNEIANTLERMIA